MGDRAEVHLWQEEPRGGVIRTRCGMQLEPGTAVYGNSEEAEREGRSLCSACRNDETADSDAAQPSSSGTPRNQTAAMPERAGELGDEERAAHARRVLNAQKSDD